MRELVQPPQGCAWWKPGDPTDNPPEDDRFLRGLAQRGFSTFIGPTGLAGATNEAREVVFIHRGRGKRWELILRAHDADVCAATVIELHTRSNAAIAWLSGQPFEHVRRLLAD